jgi:hypothetical protein
LLLKIQNFCLKKCFVESCCCRFWKYFFFLQFLIFTSSSVSSSSVSSRRIFRTILFVTFETCLICYNTQGS